MIDVAFVAGSAFGGIIGAAVALAKRKGADVRPVIEIGAGSVTVRAVVMLETATGTEQWNGVEVVTPPPGATAGRGDIANAMGRVVGQACQRATLEIVNRE